MIFASTTKIADYLFPKFPLWLMHFVKSPPVRVLSINWLIAQGFHQDFCSKPKVLAPIPRQTTPSSRPGLLPFLLPS
jgi:hypothetical protein